MVLERYDSTSECTFAVRPVGGEPEETFNNDACLAVEAAFDGCSATLDRDGRSMRIQVPSRSKLLKAANPGSREAWMAVSARFWLAKTKVDSNGEDADASSDDNDSDSSDDEGEKKEEKKRGKKQGKGQAPKKARTKTSKSGGRGSKRGKAK
jgi:hypothetical protein